MVRSRGHEQTVYLVRSRPLIKFGWLDVRSGFGRRIRKFEISWVEIRDSALVVYETRNMVIEMKTDQISEARGLEIAESALPEEIEVVPLRDARIVGNSKKNIVTIRNSDRKAPTDIKFPEESLYLQWSDVIRECTGLRQVTLADFDIDCHVGKGASGRVYLVRERVSREKLALKVIEKSFVYESEDSYRHALDERIVLEIASKHPFVLNMKYAFQNKERLFLVTEFCEGGDLFEYLNKKSRPMDEPKARMVAAEILLAIEHVHSLGIVYRDLKPENILLDREGHIRLADFGLSKRLRQRNGEMKKTKTFCGTREYVAPEMLANSYYDVSVDFWAFGILIYEMLCGTTPFYSSQRDKIYQLIETAEVLYPDHISGQGKDLLQKLLMRDMSMRLGLGKGGIGDIKAHPWFAGIDWDYILLMNDHPHGIAHELRIMNCGSICKPPTTKKDQNKKRRQLEEKALLSLQEDVEADMRAIEQSSPLTFSSISSPKTPSGRPGFVVPVSKTRKRSPMIAGYSFNGSAPSTTTYFSSSEDRKYSDNILMHTGLSEGKRNILSPATIESGSTCAPLWNDKTTRHAGNYHIAGSMSKDHNSLNSNDIQSSIHRSLSQRNDSLSSDLDDLADKCVESINF